MPNLSNRASRISSILAVAAIAAVVAAPSSAAPAKPEPCDGKLLIKDPAGDQTTTANGVVPLFATPDNTDVLGLFFRADGEQVTANIVISDLNTTPMSPFSAIRYRAYATVGGEIHYFQALVAGSDVTYSYGGELPAVSYTEQGSTTGALFEGKNGIVQIVLPPDVGGKVGTLLAATSATTGLLTLPVPAELMTPPLYFQADTAPDGSEDGPSTKPEPCAATAVEAGGPASGGAVTAPPTIKVSSSAQSAKKASKKKSVSFSVTTSEALSSVVMKLKKGSNVVASGKAASLSGTGTLKLKLKQKKLKKGSYTLTLAAKRASGEAVSATFKVKLKS
jgi:hypothetical protein